MNEKKEYIERGALSERAEIIRKKMITEKHEPFTIDIMNDFADLLDQYAKDIPAADVEPVVRTVGDLIKSIIRCNSIIALYEEYPEEEGRPLYEIWRGMEWEISAEHSNRKFVQIFGAIPESILQADTINIQVERSGSGE